MTRGMFSSITENEAYRDADKEWFVELQRYHMYWYDLVVNPGEAADYFDTRKIIVDYLKSVKKIVEDNLEKRFIYFICSRTKVRFNTKKKARYNPITKKVKIHLLVGKNENNVSVYCKFFDIPLGRLSNPKIDLTDKYITITDSRGDLTTASVHDFLSGSSINIGISSNVEYVGYTENPHTRPTNGSHTGISDVLYKVSNENFDTLIYFNVFKVTTRAVSQNSMLNFTLPNAMTDEIGAELEGKVIEKSFIFYFDALSQARNKDREKSELMNNLYQMACKNNISSIQFCYEFDEPNDYASFSSSRVTPSYRHTFTAQVADEALEIKDGSKMFDQIVEPKV